MNFISSSLKTHIKGFEVKFIKAILLPNNSQYNKKCRVVYFGGCGRSLQLLSTAFLRDIPWPKKEVFL
jgi:hypothetical protein